MSRWLFLLAATLMLGCSDDGSGGNDPDEPTCADRACPVQLETWLCPPGWTSPPGFADATGADNTPVGLEPFSICEPPVQQTCGPGEVQLLGQSACQTIGTTCPTDDFPDDATIAALAANHAGTVHFVLPGASGTGTRADPAGTIVGLLPLSAAGDVIVLGRGELIEGIDVRKDVAIVGACVRDTILRQPTAHTVDGTVHIRSGATITNLSVSGERPGIMIDTVNEPVTVHQVEVSGAQGRGIVVYQSSAVELDGVVVRDTRSFPDPDGTQGQGIYIQDSGAVVRHAVLERNRGTGVVVRGDSTSTFEDLVVRHTQGHFANDEDGTGLATDSGPELTVRRALFEGNHDIGVGLACTTTLEDLVVRDTLAELSTGRLGRGLDVTDGAQVSLRRGVFERNHERGVAVSHLGTFLTATDLIVRDTQPRPSDDDFGLGVHITHGAGAALRRVVSDRNHGVGLSVFLGSSLEASDVIVRDTRALAIDDTYGKGIEISQGSTAVIERALLERNRDGALAVFSADTLANLSDVTIRDTLAYLPTGEFGDGVQVGYGALLSLTGAVLEGNRNTGVMIATASDTATPVQSTLRNIVIRDTRAAECAELPAGEPGSCADNGGRGSGLLAFHNGLVLIADFEITGSAMCGVQIASDSRVTAMEGEIRDNVIGINVQVDDYDYSSIADSVEFSDNDVDLDATTLPVPNVPVPGG